MLHFDQTSQYMAEQKRNSTIIINKEKYFKNNFATFYTVFLFCTK